MTELYQYQIDDIVVAQQLLETVLKTSKVNHSAFEHLLVGLIDSFAAQEHHFHNTHALYARVITFCADRIFQLEKQRATVKTLKRIAGEFSSRDQYMKDHVTNRISEHVSVGDHQFSAFKPEFLANYQEKLENVEQVFEYYCADRIKAKQRKLTSFANGIQKELLNAKLANVLTRSEKDKVSEVVSIINGIKQTVTHAKERKARAEKRKQIERQNREHQCKQAVTKVFNIEPMPLPQLVNLAFALYNTVDHKYWHEFQPSELINRIDRYTSKNMLNFLKSHLAEKAQEHLADMAEKAWKLDNNLNYIKVSSPETILQAFHDKWVAEYQATVNERYGNHIAKIEAAKA